MKAASLAGEVNARYYNRAGRDCLADRLLSRNCCGVPKRQASTAAAVNASPQQWLIASASLPLPLKQSYSGNRNRRQYLPSLGDNTAQACPAHHIETVCEGRCRSRPNPDGGLRLSFTLSRTSVRPGIAVWNCTATNPNVFDCSSFVALAYDSAGGLKIR